MRAIISTTLLISILIIHSFAQDRPEDIVAYYMLLPDNAFFQTMDEYEGQDGRRKLLTPTETREVIVDRSRAYIQIKDWEWELANKITLTYFNQTNGERLIGVSQHLEGGDCDIYYTHFYRYSKQEWIDVTGQVLPPYSFMDFWGDQPVPEILSSVNIDKVINWDYELPRFGTSIKLTPVSPSAMICFDHEISADNGSAYEEQIYAIWDAVKSRQNEYIELEFNRDRGRFFRVQKIE